MQWWKISNGERYPPIRPSSEKVFYENKISINNIVCSWLQTNSIWFQSQKLWVDPGWSLYRVSHIKINAPHRVPPLKNEPHHNWKTPPAPPLLNSEAPFHEIILRKKPKKIRNALILVNFNHKTTKRWLKFPKNVIFSFGAFKTL